MQSTFCVNCKQPLPAGAAFCGNCGTRQPTTPDAAAPTMRVPPPVPADANAAAQIPAPPPAPTGDNAPTALVPPPVPEATLRADAPPSVSDPYASQYNVSFPPPPSGPPAYAPYGAPGSGPGPSGPYAPPPNPQAPFIGSSPQGPFIGSSPQGPFAGSSPQAPFSTPPPPPGYAPGPPPTAAPGGVAPWAQPQKKSGRRFAFGCVVAIVLVVLVLGGGGFLAFKLLASGKSGATNTGQHAGSTPVTANTPGAGNTPAPTNTPAASAGGQALNNLNIQAIYAGVTITIMSAEQGLSVPNFQPQDPSIDALRIQARLDNSTDTHSVGVTANTTIIGSNGNPYDLQNTGAADSLPYTIPGQANILGYWYFKVPHGSSINDWKLVIGAATELQETIPLNGVGYDSSVWQWVTTPITTKNTVTYYGGALTGTVTQVTTGVWTPGFQAPTGMRFILVDLKVTNNSAASVNVGDPEFALLLPDGSRENQKTAYGYFIDDVLGGHESKDEGYICFLAPPAKGDFQMLFFNTQNGVQAMIDLGTI